MHGFQRFMNTDNAGLGKTVQAALAAELPVLVAAPTYLVQHWEQWLAEHYPNETVVVPKGDRFKRQKALQQTADWYIINTEMLRQPFYRDAIRKDLRTLILDESHHLRNRNAQQARGALEIAERTPYVYMLTASPIWKEVDDLYMQLRILHPDVFTSYWRFVDYYCIKDETRWGTKILGLKKAVKEELDEMLTQVRIGRTYKEVGRALPPAIQHTVTVEFPPGLMKQYKELKEFYRIQEIDLVMANSASVMHALRQLTAWHGKRDAVADIVQDNPGPYGIVTWYKDSAESLADELNANAELNGGRFEYVTGDFKPDERRRRAFKTKESDKNGVVTTMASLSEGIDLSHCRTVIFFEEHYPPGANYQMISRFVRERQAVNLTEGRPGNDEPILVFYVHTKNTIDEVIHRVSKRRQATARDVLKETLWDDDISTSSIAQALDASDSDFTLEEVMAEVSKIFGRKIE